MLNKTCEGTYEGKQAIRVKAKEKDIITGWTTIFLPFHSSEMPKTANIFFCHIVWLTCVSVPVEKDSSSELCFAHRD